jgi:hypothetical protein
MRAEFLLFGMAVIGAQPALACELHERESAMRRVQLRAEAPISFSADKPSAPVEGEIWIDAASGAQYRFADGRWEQRSRPIVRASTR